MNEVLTTPAPAASPNSGTAHEPWCDDHYQEGKHPSDSWCQSTRVTIGGVATHIGPGLDDRAGIWLADEGEGNLTPEEALQLARRLSALAGQLVPASSEGLRVLAEVAEQEGLTLADLAARARAWSCPMRRALLQPGPQPHVGPLRAPTVEEATALAMALGRSGSEGDQ